MTPSHRATAAAVRATAHRHWLAMLAPVLGSIATCSLALASFIFGWALALPWAAVMADALLNFVIGLVLVGGLWFMAVARSRHPDLCGHYRLPAQACRPRLQVIPGLPEDRTLVRRGA